MRDVILSLNESEFIVKALREEQRVDGRRPFEHRPPKYQIHGDGTCEVQLGHTRALAVATGELSPPFRDRPSEGIFAVNVELGPMASPEYEAGGRPPDEAVELARVLERGLKQSGAVDTESLVVQAGRWVWSVRLDVHILDHGGNVAGAASLAALAALLTFRRSEVTVSPETGQLDVHPEEQREPLALSLHHLPVLLTFAFYDSAGELVVLDPTADEERAAKGVMTVTINSQRDVCGVQKAGGVAISAAQLLRCMRIAATQAVKATDQLRAEVQAHAKARLSGRVRRHRPGDAPVQPPSGFVLGALLPGEQQESAAGASAMDADAYLKEPGEDEEPGAEDEGRDAAEDTPWDMVEPAASFPFSGPLLPAAAARHGSNGGGDAADEADGEAAARLPKPHQAPEEAPLGNPTSLLAAVKQPRRRT